ncbi:MAG: J domain-containing protein [Xanthobacteraceae bacterium]
MTTDSPLFDRIRVRPDKDRRPRAQCPGCEWPSCTAPATHRAPKGRLREKEYWRFCLDHVREYNHGYNFFAGMNADDIARYQREAIIGHRPTWKMGMNGGRAASRSHSSRLRPDFGPAGDPFEVLREFGASGANESGAAKAAARSVRNAERKALDTLGLDPDASAQEAKARFNTLVKRHHPDANGGDRSSEDKLREIIQAYKYLKSIGFR